jgi:hypothetical protein
MGFDSQKGHNHWHFEQFARYTLLKLRQIGGGDQP